MFLAGSEEFHFITQRSDYPNSPDIEFPPKGQGLFKRCGLTNRMYFLFNSVTNYKGTHYQHALYSLHDTLGKLRLGKEIPPNFRPLYLKDSTTKVFGGFTIFDVDFSLDSVMLITDTDGLLGQNVVTSDTLFRIFGPKQQMIQSAFMVDDKTIHTNIGIYKFTTQWNLEYAYPVSDIIRLYPINSAHTIALRANADTVALMVGTQDGTIIRELGGGFGTPYCAVVDSVHNWLHVGDSKGVVATYDIGDALSVVGKQAPIPSSSTVFDVAVGRINVPEGEDEVAVTFYTILGEKAITSVYHTNAGKSQAIILPQHPGLYVAIATTHNRQLDFVRLMVGSH